MTSEQTTGNPHPWHFTRRGGIFQVEIRSARDLEALSQLDPKLWVALSCPVNDLEMDRRTLSLIDHDADGRVRIEEMMTAVEWSLERLNKPESLFEGGPLPLDAINTDDETGARIHASAKRILTNMGLADAAAITVEQAANTEKIYGQSRLNGDGVIAADATEAPDVQDLIADIITCAGGTKDRNGEIGITKDALDRFFKELADYNTWWTRGEDESAKGEDVFPLGDETPGAFTHLKNVETKIDDFFARCRLAAFDPRAEAPLNHDVSIFKNIAEDDLSKPRPDVEALPLSKIQATDKLSLGSGINPEWSARMAAFRKNVLAPLHIGADGHLHADEWRELKKRFEAYRHWRTSKPETAVEALPLARIRELLASDLKEQVDAILKEDARLAPEMKAIDSVEMLARYHRDLIRILNNFVNFNDFYDPSNSAIFQAGELFLDGRECHLCLRVENPAKHAVLATLSRAFVAYCECRRKDSPQTFFVAAVFSAGDSSNLIVGRNGIFRDRQGLLWDTTIVRLIENPISIHEAFLMPYIRIGRFIGEKIEKWAVSRDKAMQKQMQTGVESVGKESSAADGSTQDSFASNSGVAAMLAAGGIALGAVGAGLASLFDTIKALTWWELPLVIFGAVFMISFPSMVIAWLKIRKRTLAPLLDASGWAVNGRTLISPQVGRRLTTRASLPIAANCNFEEGPRIRSGILAALGITILIVIILASYLLFS